MMRFCPNCETERPLSEMVCEGEVDGLACGWDLTSVRMRPEGWRPAPDIVVRTEPTGRLCVSGHQVEDGDLLCPTCGADLEESGAPSIAPGAEPRSATTINGWSLDRILPAAIGAETRYLATQGGREAVLTLYAEGHEPDAEIYEVLRTLPRDHVPEIFETGRWEDRAYEVAERFGGGTLAETGPLPGDITTVSAVLRELGGALDVLGTNGIRHRDLHPGTIVVRTREPLDLVVTGYGSARLSESDLDVVSPLETTRYTAPEAMAGGVAAASDWWSLGVMLLEQITRGACFEGVNDQAFLIHVVTNGAPIPENLDPALDLLLRGLLALDRRERWGWEQAQAWLAGDRPVAPARGRGNADVDVRQAIRLGTRTFNRPAAFALAAADAQHWDEAQRLLLSGALATWARDADLPRTVQRELSDYGQRQDILEDFRLGLALKALNPAMPLACRGEIITPGWLLDHPQEGIELVLGTVPDILEVKGAEPWLVRLKARAIQIRQRARELNIELSEPEFEVHLLSTSKPRMAALWAERRALLPDTDHPGLAALLDRKLSAEEDYILLLSADVGQFRTVDVIVTEAAETAARAGIAEFSVDAARSWLEQPRRELYAAIEERLADFARCGNERVDEWADQFRLERRLMLSRALGLVALPKDNWRTPPRQHYFATLLGFFSKRITGAVMRGPLTRMLITKSSARLDLTELGGARRSASSVLDHILLRNDQAVDLEPDSMLTDDRIERRVRTLHKHATLYRRDTGIDGLYVGFPTLVMQERKTGVKPRIAPVLLWPVKLKAADGTRGRISVAFDRDREEVRLNPAFETLLGATTAQQWRAAADELLSRASLSALQVMEGFGDLVAGMSGTRLAAMPGKDVRAQAGKDQLACAGAIFHLAYIGQAVMEDLRHLQRIPPSASALETAFRVGGSIERPATQRPMELDRYFTAASDPSQERAVLEARDAQGLLIEGPPGTGKSQTIVNMVCDAIGRQKSLLIVCQKQSALEVVRKRLAAEGLGDRIVMINDVNKDRQPVIKAVRAQLDQLFGRAAGASVWSQQRRQTAARIEALETDLNQHHDAIYADDAECGLSYRQILSDLIDLQSRLLPTLDVPSLRAILARLHVAEVVSLQETLGPLARLWLPADFEDSALKHLLPFGSDPASTAAFQSDFLAFAEAEAQRDATATRTEGAFDIDEPGLWQHWSDTHGAALKTLDQSQRDRLAKWLDIVWTPSRVDSHKTELDAIVSGLAALPQRATVGHADRAVISLNDRELPLWLTAAEHDLVPLGFLDWFSLSRWMRARRYAQHVADLNVEKNAYRQALVDEIALRPWRERLRAARAALGELAEDLASSPVVELLATARALRGDFEATYAVSLRYAAHPKPDIALDAARAATRAAVDQLIERQEKGIERYSASRASLASLSDLEAWLEPAWSAERVADIHNGQSGAKALAAITAALPSVPAYQRFRPRVGSLNGLALQVLKALRSVRGSLKLVPEHDLDDQVRQILTRESRLSWKAKLEQSKAALHFEREELESKVRSLTQSDKEMRRLNQRLLVEVQDATRVRPLKEWEDITRLIGARARRLREFIDRGAELGLMALRPIWLMNPDVASRVLPLTKGLFDAVIYDEASQMPVEYALPTLFRSQRMIVSGDEKQMPPTSFFSSRVENDEADIFEGDDAIDEAGESGREAVEETWNRREIKDCPDLLQLAKTVLPSTTLQIHYRSAYRELIEFSNAAFYERDLSVPARHPDAKIRAIRPIEVVRADGVYEDQVNPIEARRVVDVLAAYWSDPVASRPTIGVVTFNRKQADLIEEALESRAEADSVFRSILTEERDRLDNGEDVGFFVKNVENVQGDERDVIIFSSTFGRNSQGTFRRLFGVLGQTGGERRLNVAVTRAKQKVVLVTSMPIAEISDFLSTRKRATTTRDHLQAYFEYARAISAGELDAARALLDRLGGEAKEPGRRSDDDADRFQEIVKGFVEGLGYSVHAGGASGAFALDLAVEDPRSGLFGLGIECDAPRHELLLDARAREMWRPAVLSRSVKAVHRVSSQAWLQRPELEQERLRRALETSLEVSVA